MIGKGKGSYQALKTECKYGHPFTPENTYIFRRVMLMRQCRECSKRKAKEFHRKHPGYWKLMKRNRKSRTANLSK